MRRDRRARLGPVAGDDVDDAGRDARLERELGQCQRSERRVLGRRDDDRVAGGDRRRGLVDEHGAGRVPRDHGTDDAERFPQCQADRVGHVGRQGQSADLVGLPRDEPELPRYPERTPVRAADLL